MTVQKQNIVNFNTALEMTNGERRHLLLGNGFSIALFPSIFAYKRLFDNADFTAIPESRQAFQLLSTTDFEEVIHALKTTAKVLPEFTRDANLPNTIKTQSNIIKELLIQAIAANHPENPIKSRMRNFHLAVSFFRILFQHAYPVSFAATFSPLVMISYYTRLSCMIMKSKRV